MKKSLLAVAVLGAMSGAAFAQVAPNNITLYGIVDAGLQNQRVTGTSLTSSSVTGLNSGIQSGNRWGLRGSEDLGGGLRANFNLESGFSLDNGAMAQGSTTTNTRALCVATAAPNAVTSPSSACATGQTTVNAVTSVSTTDRLFGRAAWMGLSGGFGEVRLGRQTIFSSASVVGIADPFGVGFGLAGYQFSFPNLGAIGPIVNTAFGSTVLGSRSAATQRNDNTLTYLTPNFSGLQAGLYYTFGEKVSSDTGAKNNWVGGGVTYTKGPLALGLSYDSLDSSTTGALQDDKWINLAASYNFGVATARFGYYDEEGRTGALPGGARNVDRNGWILGATVPLAGGNLLASYQKGDIKPTGLAKTKLDKYAFGYTYPLSRRTNVYTSYAQGQLKEPGLTVKAREFSLGVRHTF